MSRAIIRKGKIITKSKITPVGHEFSFYDEKGEKIKKLSVWRDCKRV